ncbi:MAG: RpiB/LacA/LacB family sugar-phosphate isomerase [Anaerolineales bacterium]
MKIAVGSDEQTVLTDVILEWLDDHGFEVNLHGPIGDDRLAWPDVARQVAEAVAHGSAEEGILLCWTGTGVSIAANKVPGIRAALCDDAETARGARLWNDANVLCLSLRRTSPVMAAEILETWFKTSYQPNSEDDACLRSLELIEQAHSPKDEHKD